MNRVRRLLEGQDRPRLRFASSVAPLFFASLLPVMLAVAASASHAQSVANQPLFPVAPAPRPPVLVAQARPDPAPQSAAQAAPAAQQELETPYKKWLNEEVVYIISDEERRAFRQLIADEEREEFIEQFWLRRDPTPDTERNEYLSLIHI